MLARVHRTREQGCRLGRQDARPRRRRLPRQHGRRRRVHHGQSLRGGGSLHLLTRPICSVMQGSASEACLTIAIGARERALLTLHQQALAAAGLPPTELSEIPCDVREQYSQKLVMYGSTQTHSYVSFAATLVSPRTRSADEASTSLASARRLHRSWATVFALSRSPRPRGWHCGEMCYGRPSKRTSPRVSCVARVEQVFDGG